MKHGLLVLIAVTFALSGCKGKVEYRDNPEVVTKLQACETSLGEKDIYIKDLQKQLSDLKLHGGDGPVVVNIEGEAMTITGGKGPSGKPPREPRGNADDAKLYEAFVASLRRSRGSIKKCYQNALKKNSSIQGRTVTLNIGVDYRTSGKVANARFSPRISQTFNKCMAGVAQNWKLPAMPRAVSFNYRQTLTPE
jgi:hypothetical protein